MSKILIVGCGQLGSRHLQAVAGLDEVDAVDVIDPHGDALQLGQTRLRELADASPRIRWQWLKRIDEASVNADLCIVATLAKPRASVIREVAEKLNVKRFFIEKLVTPSMEEYNDLVAFSNARKLSIWVNCKTRAYGVHRHIQERLSESDEPIIFSMVAGNHGLVNNGIHSADIFVFHDGTGSLHPASVEVDRHAHPSKRGRGLYDLSGTMTGYSDKGSRFLLSFAADHEGPGTMILSNARWRFVIDHFQKYALESSAEKNWAWERIPIDENWNVSFMTRAFVRDILREGSCAAPTLLDCLPAHRFILEGLQPHFNRLLKRDSNFCPAT